MVKVLEALRRMIGRSASRGERRARQRRRDPEFVGGTRIEEIEQAPPGRAEELAGHAVERVET
jgi:hypothetical protein